MAKKSWHTTNFKNVEKVWVAEHQAQEEQKKVAELQKQIMEERQIQELRKLQVASGQVVKTVDTTLDWMYEGPAAAQQQSSEEYLLGKVYQAKEEKVTDVHKVGNNAGALWLNKTTSKNDTFTRLHEDPMLMIKQQEKKNLEKILNNPLKMEKVRQTVAAAQAMSSSSSGGLGEEIRSGKRKDEAYYLNKQEKKKSKKEAKKEMKKDAKRAAKEDKKSKSKGERNGGGEVADAPTNDRNRKRSRSESSSSDSEDDDHAGRGDLKRSAVAQNDPPAPSVSRHDVEHRKGKEDDSDSRPRPPQEPLSRSAGVDQQKHPSHHRDRHERDDDNRDSRDRGQDRGFDRRRDDRDRDSDRARDGDRSQQHHPLTSSSSSSSSNRGYDRDHDRDHDRDRDRDRPRDRSRSRDRDRGGDRGDRDRDHDRNRDRDRDSYRSRHQDDRRGSASAREAEESSRRPAPRVIPEESHETTGHAGGDSMAPGATSNSTSTSSSSNDVVPTVAVAGEKRYGLVKGTANASTGYLGPKLDLLKKKMDEERAEQQARQRPRESVKHLSEEEKQSRRRQMEIDAGINDDRRVQRVHVNTSSSSSSSSSSQADDHRRNDDVVDEKESHSHGASFLKTMRSEVYTMGEGSTMTERLQQNKHYTQKGVDLDSDGFMKK